MRQYETAFLIAPNLEEEETEKIISRMAEVVSQKNGKMIKEDRWGKRKLAYPIQRFEEAFYVFFLYEGDPGVPSELERLFKQTEPVLRYLTVKKDTKPNVRRKRKAAPPPQEAPPDREEDSRGEEKVARRPVRKTSMHRSEKEKGGEKSVTEKATEEGKEEK